jgi:hypothetical protein
VCREHFESSSRNKGLIFSPHLLQAFAAAQCGTILGRTIVFPPYKGRFVAARARLPEEGVFRLIFPRFAR